MLNQITTLPQKQSHRIVVNTTPGGHSQNHIVMSGLAEAGQVSMPGSIKDTKTQGLLILGAIGFGLYMALKGLKKAR